MVRLAGVFHTGGSEAERLAAVFGHTQLVHSGDFLSYRERAITLPKSRSGFLRSSLLGLGMANLLDREDKSMREDRPREDKTTRAAAPWTTQAWAGESGLGFGSGEVEDFD